MKIRLAGIEPASITDGPGFRYTVFVQGCPHKCPGCHNPQTHDFTGGYDADTDALLEEFAADPLLAGMTFSGGEPFCQPAPLAEMAEKVHAMGKSVVCYSGWTYERLLAMEDPAVEALLAACDVLVDGPFLLEQRNLDLRFRGSENQRCIDLNATRRAGETVLLPW
ncbi:MAG: anaerobic ribonucleoside-triphosphate reductase activating protein [Clostridia bacterium]|nr:anaerobic ribonucleoside-triphosphate reductase activating protein [Clostridia bacterium]